MIASNVSNCENLSNSEPLPVLQQSSGTWQINSLEALTFTLKSIWIDSYQITRNKRKTPRNIALEKRTIPSEFELNWPSSKIDRRSLWWIIAEPNHIKCLWTCEVLYIRIFEAIYNTYTYEWYVHTCVQLCVDGKVF